MSRTKQWQQGERERKREEQRGLSGSLEQVGEDVPCMQVPLRREEASRRSRATRGARSKGPKVWTCRYKTGDR